MSRGREKGEGCKRGREKGGKRGGGEGYAFKGQVRKRMLIDENRDRGKG